MEIRQCKICNETKELDEFYKKNKLHYSSKCKKCENKENSERRQKRLKEDDEYRKEYNRKKNERRKLKKELGKNYKPEIRVKAVLTKEEEDKHRKEINRKRYERMKRRMMVDDEYRKRINRKGTNRKRKKYHNDSVYKLRVSMKSIIKKVIKEKFGISKSTPTMKIIGLNQNDFFNYIESLFQEGMTWDNRGDWHIDHIVPLGVAKTVDEVKYLNHYTNLRPMWGEDNLSKGDRIDEGNLNMYNKFLMDMRNIS